MCNCMFDILGLLFYELSLVLHADYRFLEDAGRKADEASRERPQKGSARHVSMVLVGSTS